MQPTLAAAVLFSLVSATLSFSRGASSASCRDMTPGHISAHPLDPRQNHITLRASSSSYLPGQLLIVTVRSSQDFMGFLLQARSVELAVGRAGVGVWTENGVKEEIRSARMGPILMGGHWTLAPPGTHKLRCVSDDDTLTHSDKQLKRNLSFVWKAPDAPMGDFQFYITVVQSYFVHWAGIESLVVRDQSRGSRTGGNIAAKDEQNSKPTATASRATQSYGSEETATAVVHPISESTRSGKVNLKEQHVTESSGPFGPHQTVTTSRFVLGVSQEASKDSPVLTAANANTAPALVPLKDSTMKQKEEQRAPSVPRLKETLNQQSTSEVFLLKNPHHSNSAASTPVPQTGPWTSWISHTKSEISLIREEIGNRSALQAPDPHSRLLDHSQKADRPPNPSASVLRLQTTTNLPISTSQTSSQYLGDPTKPPSGNPTLVRHHPSLLELLRALSHREPSGHLTKHSQYRPSGPTTWNDNSPEPPRGFLQTLTQTPQVQSFIQKPTQTVPVPRSYPPSTLAENPNFASTLSVTPLSTLKSLHYSTTNTVPATSLHHSSFITSLHPPGHSKVVSKQTFSPHESLTSSTIPRNPPRTPPALSALPSPAPISTPPHMALLQPSSSSSVPGSSLKPPSGSSARVRTSPSSTTSQHITSLSPLAQSPTTTSVTASSVTPSLLSVGSISPTSLFTPSGSTSSHPEPSPLPSRSLSEHFTSTFFSVTHQQLPKDQGSLTRHPAAPSEPQAKPTPTVSVHPNPAPYPNFDSHLKANINSIKPHPPDTEYPTNPTRTPGKEGKFPDIVPRYSTWELGMLLGCSAGLGMVLVVGLRYMYSQACGKRTEVTLNDSEREYPRGERGLIHVQECGDLVRVRRIRDNSFVFLAEYDILTSPGD